MVDAFAIAVSRPRFGGVDGARALKLPKPTAEIRKSFHLQHSSER
jgi:hypothetical protein